MVKTSGRLLSRQVSEVYLQGKGCQYMQYSILIKTLCSVHKHNKTLYYTVWLEIQYNKSKKSPQRTLTLWNMSPVNPEIRCVSHMASLVSKNHAITVSIGSTLQSIVHPEKLLFNIHSWQTLRSLTIFIHFGFAWMTEKYTCLGQVNTRSFSG